MISFLIRIKSKQIYQIINGKINNETIKIKDIIIDNISTKSKVKVTELIEFNYKEAEIM